MNSTVIGHFAVSSIRPDENSFAMSLSSIRNCSSRSVSLRQWLASSVCCFVSTHRKMVKFVIVVALRIAMVANLLR